MTVDMPGERPEVSRFAATMEVKLRQHDPEREDSWKRESPWSMLARLQEEARDFISAIAEFVDNPSAVSAAAVRWEAADVANFAMFIAEIAERQIAEPAQSEESAA